jgi:hypothetical protein
VKTNFGGVIVRNISFLVTIVNCGRCTYDNIGSIQLELTTNIVGVGNTYANKNLRNGKNQILMPKKTL